MPRHVDYYVFLNSPFTYLGSQRFEEAVKRHGASVTIWPMDWRLLFAAGGMPSGSKQRQAYFRMELKRWRDRLGVKLNLTPKYFTSDELPAAKCVVALREQGRMEEAIAVAHAVLRGVWAEDKNPGDPDTVRDIVASCGLDADAVMKAAEAPELAGKREAYTRHAIARNVFGAPSYVIDGEIFWGQDRLDFVERKLSS